MILIYTTCKDMKEAKKIAKHLLNKKLVACINTFPISSMYKWKGKLESEKEIAMILKSNKSFKSIEKEIKKIGSYDIPCIIELDVENTNKEFERWVKGESR